MLVLGILKQVNALIFNSRVFFLGVDVTANQEEISDHETFQMEYDDSTGGWYLRTMQDKYFVVGAGGGVQANSDKRTKEGLFQLSWHEDGSVSFQVSHTPTVL